MNENKYLWIDFTKSLAAFAVIILHLCVSTVNNFADTSIWWSGHVYDSLTRFCVPIFVMISGALLLGKDEDLMNFLKKRFSRIIYPFLFWSFIYLLIKLNYELSIKEILSQSIKLLKTGTEFHLWYIYMIMGLYLFIPILRKWTTRAPRKEFIYFILLWVLVMSFNYPLLNKLYSNIDFRYFSGYIGYLVLGYFLIKFSVKNHTILAFIFFISSATFTIFATYYFSLRKNGFDSTFYNFLSPNVMLLSVGTFLLSKSIIIKNEIIKRIILEISKYSYGIYLSHVFILIIISKLHINIIPVPFFSIPITAIFILIFSYFLVFIISKIPFIGKYISGA